jgi:hypothetical protein
LMFMYLWSGERGQVYQVEIRDLFPPIHRRPS